MRELVGGGVVLALLTGAAEGQVSRPSPAPVVKPCKDVPDASERLRCYDEDANFDFAAVILKELECERAPRAAEVIRLLIRRNAVRSMAFQVADGFNYFALSSPQRVDGLNVVAVFGFDETGRFPFLRDRGPSPGPIFGIVTRDSLGASDRWRLTHSPGLMSDETASNMKGARDIACMRAEPADEPAVARSRRPSDEAFDAGLAPKPR